MTRTSTRLPIGATPDYAPTTPPRYVPGLPILPLDCRPLSECDTLPPLSLPRVVYRRYRRHSRLYWLAWDARWWVADTWDTMRYETGWIGQIAVMVLCAVAVLAVALAVVLWGLR